MVEFTWDPKKDQSNFEKHGVNFRTAIEVFVDPHCRVFFDGKHSIREERYYAVGKVGEKILTVRFTYREDKIRIIGAGFWRKGRIFYEEKNKGTF